MKRLWKFLLASLVITTGVHAAEVNDLSTTDASNTARWPEAMAPSAVNNAARATEGILARWYRDWNGSAVTGGSANTYTLSANQTLSAYFDGLKLTFEVTPTNSGASTLNVDGIGAKSIVKYGATAVEAGDLNGGQKYTVVYDGTNFQLVNSITPFASTVTSGNIPLFSGTTGRFTDSGIPSKGTAGQVLQTNSGATASAWATLDFGLASVQTFTESGTWTRPSGITKVIVEVIGGGGGGGGSDNTGSGQGGFAGGGGGGGFAKKLVDVSSIASSTITIGAKGTGGAAGGLNDGTNGGDSSWADGTNTVTGAGGKGGKTAQVAVTARGGGGAGGLGSGGDVNGAGDPGGFGFGTGGVGFGGVGGGSALGGGAASAENNNDGNDATTPGAGGGGAAEIGAAAGQAGGDGAAGIVIVWEFK